jgi:hypothetical protein
MRIGSTKIRVRRTNSRAARGRTDRRAVVFALMAFVVGGGSALASYVAEPDSSCYRALPAKITARAPSGEAFPQALGTPRSSMSLATMGADAVSLAALFPSHQVTLRRALLHCASASASSRWRLGA